MDESLIVPTVIWNLDLAAVRDRLIRKKDWTADYADRLIEEYAAIGGNTSAAIVATPCRFAGTRAGGSTR